MPSPTSGTGVLETICLPVMRCSKGSARAQNHLNIARNATRVGAVYHVLLVITLSVATALTLLTSAIHAWIITRIVGTMPGMAMTQARTRAQDRGMDSLGNRAVLHLHPPPLQP